MAEDGKVILRIDTRDELNDDWIRSARLARRADAGDEEARKELERRENSKLVEIPVSEEDDSA